MAEKVITLEADQREARAVAVVDGRILAVGSLEQVKATIGDGRSYHIDLTFADKVIMPGFVEHHLHPLLGALTMALEIIAIEDWRVPGKFSQAVLTQEDYGVKAQQG